MKLSEIFLEAARKIPKNKYMGMCEVLRKVVFSNLKPQDWMQIQRAASILYRFRPHEETLLKTHWFSKEAAWASYKVATVEEAQALRTDILLWCSAIAESEGL